MSANLAMPRQRTMLPGGASRVGYLVRQTNGLRGFADEREFGRFVQCQGGAVDRIKPRPRGLNIPSQDLRLAHAVAVKKAMRGLGAGPVPARQRQRPAKTLRELLHQQCEPRSQSSIGKPAPREFLIDP